VILVVCIEIEELKGHTAFRPLARVQSNQASRGALSGKGRIMNLWIMMPYQIRNILEAPSLFPITIYSHWLFADGLQT